MPQAEFDAAEKAVQYDSTNAAYYVKRGYARWRLAHGNPDRGKLQEDIDAAFEAGEPPPGAYGLGAHAKFIDSRSKVEASD